MRSWSLTMYELPASLLTANPLNRDLLNSPMLPQFKRDADGGLTLIIQNESPGKDKEANHSEMGRKHPRRGTRSTLWVASRREHDTRARNLLSLAVHRNAVFVDEAVFDFS
jgi:hypothetical protein